MTKKEGWQQVLELFRRGELSDSEIEVVLQEGLPHALDEVIEQAKGGDKEAAELGRVLDEVRRELDRVVKDRMWLRRPLRRRL
jgi:hypothetical protein